MQNVNVHVISTVRNQHRNYEGNTSFLNTTLTTPDDDDIVLCASLLVVANMTESDTARINTGLLLLSFIIGENK